MKDNLKYREIFAFQPSFAGGQSFFVILLNGGDFRENFSLSSFRLLLQYDGSML